ncbi:MAG TPA: flavodoxin family protein [Candidatus Lokiarchaeia archaeon]|nr:flavodoxin family protein [Candidatus Lokiarchaeia archaeon]
MRLLGIVGSPRKGGNTEILVTEALKPAQEAGWDTELFLLSEKHVAPCDACGTCFNTNSCVIDDDMHELYQMLDQADAVIFGSPVYFGNVSAQAKAVMDRTFALLPRRSLQDKVAGVIVATRRVGAVQVRSLISSFCIAQGMIVAGAGIGYGREPGDVLEGVGGAVNSTALGEARQVGTRVVALTERLAKSQP